MISKVLYILVIFAFNSIALGSCPKTKSIDLENLYFANECKSRSCEMLRNRFFDDKNKLIEMNQYQKLFIESIQVKQDDRNSDPYLTLTAKPHRSCKTLNKGHVIYRHQVLAPVKEMTGLISTRIDLPKKTTLREANDFCLKLSKKCTWKNTINAF